MIKKNFVLLISIFILSACGYNVGVIKPYSYKKERSGDWFVDIGKYYAESRHVVDIYENTLQVKMMFYGISEESVAAGNAWIVVLFRAGSSQKPEHIYSFDTSSASTNVGELSFSRAYPYVGEPKNGMLSLHGTTNNPPDNKELFVEYKVSLADWYKEYLKDANRCSAEQTQKPTFTLNGVYKGGIPIKALTIPINTCDLSKTNNVGFEGIFVPIYGVMYLMIPLVALAGIFY